jgi:hypothetical protein
LSQTIGVLPRFIDKNIITEAKQTKSVGAVKLLNDLNTQAVRARLIYS